MLGTPDENSWPGCSELATSREYDSKGRVRKRERPKSQSFNSLVVEQFLRFEITVQNAF